MPERSSTGKKGKAPATLDLMEDVPAESAPSRPAPPAAKATAAPAPDNGAALFGGDDVDQNAKHPADVPVGNYPAPSQIPLTDTEESPADPFGEEDPFADTPMAQMLADEPAPLTAGMRAAREELFAAPSDAVEEMPVVATALTDDPIIEPVDALPQEEATQEQTPMPAAKTLAETPTPPVAARTAPGLTITRRYTQPGQNVWETTEWELRTASIVGSDGTVVFEQKGVEIPKDWSQLATNVVVSKYFRGQIGTLEREYSVKQLIGRVADRILEWGQQGSYFATGEDAEAFHDELRYILLHQMAAFNSPVWFNLGWSGRRQAVSACYINEVNDTMESILDLYKTEGLLFKDGSGCTSGDSLVYVRDAGFLPIRNLYKKFLAERRPVQEFDGKGRYIEIGDADVYTLSVDPHTGVFGMDQILRVWQYDLPQEDKLTVRLDSGAKAVVSSWHPFLVWDGEQITHRRADELRRGDAVLGPNATAEAAVPRQVATFEYETTYFGRAEKHTLTLDEDLAWLCGYFMGDGSLGAKQSRVTSSCGRRHTYDSVRLRFYDETLETLQRVQSIIARVFSERSEISQGQCCPMLTYNGRRVTRFFAQLFGIGSKTYSLSMPAFVWNSPRSVQLSFLAGLIDSDGYVAEGGRAKYSSASREFAGQVAALASFLGLGGGVVTDRHVTTAGVLHRVATLAQRQEFAAHLAHPERRRRLLETASDKPQRKFCLPLSEALAHDLFGSDRAPADWLSVPVGGENLHLGRLKYGGLINPFKLQKALRLLGRDDETTRLLSHVAESVSFVFSVTPCSEDPDFYDLTVKNHNNYLAGENGLTVIHNSGVNLSVLRSSKEPLAAGGKSSGPISFMKGLDASAGSIKSGGSTRRAACMRVLDIDHPDVEEFINCKKDAEEKAHALIDAGYSGAFNVVNGAYDTVPFQNANHSVRVTDEFMQAVEAGAEWQTKYRRTGKAATTTKARDLMHAIAEATWVCGDPGMQYDTTINDWHTCSATDRIYASNPCSEYMFLNSTACNLSSLNLMKFRTEEGGFDVESFEHAVKIMITGQEIVVGFAAYPTAKIEERSHVYRTLGLGYANLGALLMAAGLPYDSDAGRAYAGAVTAIMTGRAYEQSAAIARDCGGPFAGYAENREPMLRVMQKHREHVEEINGRLIPKALLSAARAAWDDAVTQGEQSGYRNAQATVLAPTGCLVAGSLVITDRGVVRLNRLGDVNGAQWQDVQFGVLTDVGRQEATKFYVNGLAETRRVTTRCGYAIQGTPKHRVKVVDAQTGTWDWKRFAEIAPGDIVPLSLGEMIGEPQTVTLPPLGEEHWTGDYTTRVPRAMTPELAELVGYFMGDGSLHAKGPRFCVANTDLDVAVHIQKLVKSLFNLEARLTPQQGYCEVGVHSVPLTLWWEACGFAKTALHAAHSGKGYLPSVPDAVLATNDPAVYGAFLRGLYEADGTVTNGVPCWSTVHREFSEEVKTLLLALGLPTVTEQEASAWGQSPCYTLRSHEGVFEEMHDGQRFFYDTVAANDDGGEQLTYDLSVPANVTYVAQGFVSHNTIGFLMDCDTTGIEPDIAIVKYKSLVGGGMMKIVNQTVPEALQRLGYSDNEAAAIIKFIDENDTIEGAPGLKPEHLPIFDCAFRPMNGTRSIHHMGHIKMMAAAQPFISGAISKCVTGETLLATAQGLVRIGSLYQNEKPDTFRPAQIALASLGGARPTDAFYYGGARPTVKVTLRSGHRVMGTPNHRLLVARPGRLDWARLDEIEPGDYVATQYGTNLWAQEAPRLPQVPAAGDRREKRVRMPETMTSELAWLLGAYAAEGHTTRSNWTITLTNSVDAVLERAVAAWRSEFGVEAVIERAQGKCPGVKVTSKRIVLLLQALGCGRRASEKRIPDIILGSPKDMVLSFLSGLFLDGYAVAKSTLPRMAICLDSPALLDDLQAILTNLGLVHSRISKKNAQYGKTYDEVYLTGEWAQKFARLVPFMEPDKARSAEALMARTFAQSTSDVVPGVTPAELLAFVPYGGSGQNGKTNRAVFSFLANPRTRQVSRRTLERVAALPGVVLPEWLQSVLRDNLRFSPVMEVAEGGVQPVYDVSVPVTHAFVGNGIVNHNTVNVPNDADPDTIADTYMQAWKLGLKAVAIYRDGSKRTQPLNTAKEAPAGEKAPALAVTDGLIPQAVRRRLPDERASITHKFSIAGHEGYLTVGLYPDTQQPGEIFIRMAKEGSSISGLMDSFATAISLALQYGVPLSTLVDKFIHSRFEPSGFTGNKDIPMAKSVMDYIFRYLALRFLQKEERHNVGLLADQEGYGEASPAPSAPRILPAPDPHDSKNGTLSNGNGGNGKGSHKVTVSDNSHLAETATAAVTDHEHEIYRMQSDAPPCPECGAITVRNGACYRCISCGTSLGCS